MSQSAYQSDSQAALQLSAKEREAAIQLKLERPETAPGSRAILNRAEAVAWYDKVCAMMRTLGIDRNMQKIAAFCDLAGVPN